MDNIISCYSCDGACSYPISASSSSYYSCLMFCPSSGDVVAMNRLRPVGLYKKLTISSNGYCYCTADGLKEVDGVCVAKRSDTLIRCCRQS